MSAPRIAVVRYSATGNVHAIAEALAKGARLARITAALAPVRAA